MKSTSTLLVPALLALSLAACVKHASSKPPIPVYAESERNDFDFQANDFGFLSPGDRFFIDGFIAADGSDPFDGFLFTSARPIHVEFTLFIDDPFADLDVCVYDPLLGYDVACFESLDNPEFGAIDVFGGGFDFHLVVNSFQGASSYGLEIAVYSLQAATAASPAPGIGSIRVAHGSELAQAALSDAAASESEKPGQRLANYFDHSGEDEAEPEVLERAFVLGLDENGDPVAYGVLDITADGNRMGLRLR